MKDIMMSYNMISTMINATNHNAIILMSKFPMNMMNNRDNFIHDVSINYVRCTWNHYRIINPRLPVISTNQQLPNNAINDAIMSNVPTQYSSKLATMGCEI